MRLFRTRDPFNLSWIRILWVCVLAAVPSACGDPDGDHHSLPEAVDAVRVDLLSQSPDEEAGRGMRWSPYGEQLALTSADEGMAAVLSLGPSDAEPIRLLLEKSPEAEYFDRLFIDVNRDGEFDPTELHETEVSETRGKFWSSFDAVLGVPVVDPATGPGAVNPYAASFWYVEDPRVPEEAPVIRFSRRGWMEGTVTLDGVVASVLVTERKMDGVFDSQDSWALASRDSAENIYSASYARSMDEHGWLLDRAYRVVELDPSGRRISLAPFDPGMTRAEEVAMNDDLAVDRNAPRSGRAVAFLHDFQEAEELARSEGKLLFVDFETTWCGPCKVMDEWVYTADGVVDASTALVAVKVDGDDRLDLKDRFDVQGFPTMILLDAGGAELRRTSGYVNVADMIEFLTGTG